MKRRFDHANTVIAIGSTRINFLYQYFKRTFLSRERKGRLPGAKSEFSWKVLHWGLCKAHQKHQKYIDIAKKANCELINLSSMRELNQLYDHWNMTRPE